MKKLIIAFLFLPFLLSAQSEIELPIADQFDVVAVDWLEKAGYLKTYAGIDEYCQNPDFRKSVNSLLTTIHVYDSLIIHKLEDPSTYLGWNIREEKKTRTDINSFEEEYQLTDFIEEMRSACLFKNKIEANEKDLRNGVGYESYDSKVMMLETDMSRYLNKMDRLVLKIDDHLHELKID